MCSESDTDFEGAERTVRMQSEMLRQYRLDQKAPTLVVLLGLDTGQRISLDKPEVTLVALKGSTSQEFVERVMPKAKLTLADDYDRAVALLLDDKAKAMVADYPICLVSAHRYHDKGLVTLKDPLNYEPIGIALSPNDPLLLNLTQNFVTSLLNSGDMERLRRRWFEPRQRREATRGFRTEAGRRAAESSQAQWRSRRDSNP